MERESKLKVSVRPLPSELREEEKDSKSQRTRTIPGEHHLLGQLSKARMLTVAWVFLKIFQYNLTVNQKVLIMEKVTETGQSRINTQGNDTEQKDKCSGNKEATHSHNN